jgi:hypothetical protein
MLVGDELARGALADASRLRETGRAATGAADTGFPDILIHNPRDQA